MIADCPGCRNRFTIVREDGWSYCPSCNILVYLDVSIETNPKVRAGKREGDRMVPNTRISPTYAREAGSASSSTMPPRVTPVSALTPTPPAAIPRTASPRGSARPPQRTTSSAPAQPAPRPNVASLNRMQAREERAQIAQELADLENQMRALQTTVGQSVNPERTLPIITEMALTAQRQVDLMRRDGLLQEQLASLTRQEEQQARERERQRIAASPEPRSSGSFGIAAVVAVLAMLGYSVYANVNWSASTVLAMAGVGLAIALVGYWTGRN